MLHQTHEFVDIHTHILPGVDDGAQKLSETVAMLQRAWEQGTGAVVLTPHYRGRHRDNLSGKLTPIFERVCEEAKKKCPGMELYLGCEVGYELDVAEKVAQGSVLSLNATQYVLLEFRDQVFRSRIMDGTLELLNFGYIPVIAHAERYEAFRNNPELAGELIHLGALIQINADSITGNRGFRIKRYCHKLLKEHSVHFVATDAHDLEYRKPELKKAFIAVKKRYGAQHAEALFYKNARMILSGGEDIEC